MPVVFLKVVSSVPLIPSLQGTFRPGVLTGPFVFGRRFAP